MRGAHRVLLFLAVFAAVLVVAGVLLLGWAKNRLATSGLGELDFTVEGLSLGHLSLSELSFGSGREQTLERLTLFFRPTRLLRGYPLDKVLIEGAELRFVSPDGGIPRLAGVTLPDAAGAADSGLPAIPVAALELRASRLRLERGKGTLQIPLSGILTQADAADARVLDARLEFGHRGAPEARGAEAGPKRQDAVPMAAVPADAAGGFPGGPEVRGAGRATLEWNQDGRVSGAGKLTAHLAGAPLALEVQADRAQEPGAALVFAAELKAQRLDLAVPGELAGLGEGLAGRVSLAVGFGGGLPLSSDRPLEGASAVGRVSLRIQGVTLPGQVAEASGHLDADLSLADGSLLAVPTSPWELTGRLVGPDPPMTFRVSDVEGHALSLDSSADLARQTAAGAIAFALQGSPSRPKIAGTAFGRVEYAADAEDGLRLDLERLRLDPTTWVRQGTEIHLRALEARLAGTAAHLQGRLAARLDAADTAPDGRRLTGGEITLQGRLRREGDGRVLTVQDCVTVKAKRLDLGVVRWLRPLELCIRQAEGEPLLRLDAAGTPTALALTLPSHPVALAVAGGQTPSRLTGATPQARLSATRDPTTQALDLKLDIQGGRLTFTRQALAVADLALSLRQGQTASVRLRRATVRSLATPPDFPRLTLTGEADGRWDGALTFALAAQGHKTPLKLSARGRHDFGLAIGELSYALDKIRFSPRGLQPDDILPALGGLIERARGSLALSGDLSWVAGVPVTHLRLALRNLGFDAPGGVSVRGINTRLRRAGRTVRNRLGTQEIRIALLDIGVPLRNGLIRFRTGHKASVRIEQLRFAWGNGSLQAKPFRLRLDRPAAEHPVLLTFDDIGLNDLLRLIPIDGLRGTGTLHGRIPLRIRGSEITIDQGAIQAETPGVLRYRPAKKPAFFDKNSQTELLFEALRNFHYTALSLALNGTTQDNLRLSISLAGANPDLYDGHPFKLNFNIDGELDTLMRRSLAVATFAERFGTFLSRYIR